MAAHPKAQSKAQSAPPQSDCIPKLGDMETRMIQLRGERVFDDTGIRSSHVLYCRTESLNVDDVRKAMEFYIRQILTVIHNLNPKEVGLSAGFEVNLPMTRDGRTCGHAYVYVVDVRVVNVIWGLNPDGTPREEVETIVKQPDMGSAWFSDLQAGKSWADIVEEKVVTVLPPLITSLEVMYGPSNKMMTGKKVDLEPLPSRFAFEKLEAIDPYTLIASAPMSVAGWLQNDPTLIKDRFKRFDPQRETEKWPRVHFVKGNENAKGGQKLLIYVSFSKDILKEGPFIQMITMKQDFKQNKNETTLIFNMLTKR